MKRKKLKIALCSIVALLVIIMLLPTKIQNPVEGCGRESYNQKSRRFLTIASDFFQIVHQSGNIINRNDVNS